MRAKTSEKNNQQNRHGVGESFFTHMPAPTRAAPQFRSFPLSSVTKGD